MAIWNKDFAEKYFFKGFLPFKTYPERYYSLMYCAKNFMKLPDGNQRQAARKVDASFVAYLWVAVL